MKNKGKKKNKLTVNKDIQEASRCTLIDYMDIMLLKIAWR